VHRAHLVQQWVAQHSDQLELFYLPSYSPERNPDEYLNQDMRMPYASGDRAIPRSSSRQSSPTCTSSSSGRGS